MKLVVANDVLNVLEMYSYACLLGFICVLEGKLDEIIEIYAKTMSDFILYLLVPGNSKYKRPVISSTAVRFVCEQFF